MKCTSYFWLQWNKRHRIYPPTENNLEIGPNIWDNYFYITRTTNEVSTMITLTFCLKVYCTQLSSRFTDPEQSSLELKRQIGEVEWAGTYRAGTKELPRKRTPDANFMTTLQKWRQNQDTQINEKWIFHQQNDTKRNAKKTLLG